MGLTAATLLNFQTCFITLSFLITSLEGKAAVLWYEDIIPMAAVEYTVYIAPSEINCYNQLVIPGATFYVSLEVIRGGDGMVGFAIRHPSGQIVHSYEWTANSAYQDSASQGGYYEICIDNKSSRFADKWVNLYITAVEYDKWKKYTNELQELQMNVENFTLAIVNVERNINEIVQYQHHSRAREAWYLSLLQHNNSYIVWWSIIQILVIVVTSTIQVYLVRKLFNTTNGSNNGIPLI